MAAVAAGADYRITGLREAVRKLERFGVETQDLRRAFGAIAATVVIEAKTDAPKGDTHALTNSIRPGQTKNKAIVRAGYAARVPYAGVINYGWPGHNIEPTHFLNDAADRHTAEHLDVIEAELDRLIRSLNL